MKGKSRKSIKYLIVIILIIFILLTTMKQNNVYAAIPLNQLESASTDLLNAYGQVQFEKKASNVIFSSNSSSVQNKFLTKQEAGYRQCDMGTQVSQGHEIQTDGKGVALGASNSVDPNVTYQKAIALPAGTSDGFKNYTATLTYENVGKFQGKEVGVQVSFSDINVKQSARNIDDTSAIVAKIAELNPDNVVYINTVVPDSAQRAFRSWYKQINPAAGDEYCDYEYQDKVGTLMTNLAMEITKCPETGYDSWTYRLDRNVGNVPYITYTNCFYSGFYYRNIASATVNLKVYQMDTGATINLTGAYFTANSLNTGEGIFSNDVSTAYARTDTLVVPSSITQVGGT